MGTRILFFTIFCLLAWLSRIHGQHIVANPMNLNYRFHPPANEPKGREAADPVCEYFKGKYYLFASKSGGYWSSENLADWTYIPCKSIETIEDYAPTILIHNDAIYFMASGPHPRIYRNADPDEDKWECIDTKFRFQAAGSTDPAFFKDDDGRVYVYWGCSTKDPIMGVETDPANGFAPIGQASVMIEHKYFEYGWEVFGKNNDQNSPGWNEGPCLVKDNGKYYLQYASPGTRFRIYGDGCYVSDNPLGPFVYDPTSPFSFKPGGFIAGAGHGHTFKDKYGNYWHMSTMTISIRHGFERRLGLFPAYLSPEGHWHAHTVFSDYPFEVPQRKVDFAKNDCSMGWNLLSYGKPATASSSKQGHDPALACDEKVETWWASQSGKSGEWLQVDLGRAMKVNAVQVNFADEEFPIQGFQTYFNYQYTIEASPDGRNWTRIVDRSANEKDMPHDLATLARATQARFLKITNTRELPGKFSISGFRVFGDGGGRKPQMVSRLTVSRNSDRRRFSLTWDEIPGANGYIIHWGIEPGLIKNSTMVMGAATLEAGYFNRDSKYYFTIDSFNENGITKGKTVYECD